MLRNISKPRPWRGRAQKIEVVFEDAKLLKRVEAKKTRVKAALTGRYSRSFFTIKTRFEKQTKRCRIFFKKKKRVGGSASAHESRYVTKGSEQSQCKHRGWGRWVSFQSAVGL